VDVKKLVSEVVPFEQAEEALQKVSKGKVMKILIAGPNQKLLRPGQFKMMRVDLKAEQVATDSDFLKALYRT